MIPEKYCTENVRLLARRCLEEGWDQSPTLPILADALEDADYSDLKVLINLRSGQGRFLDKNAFMAAAWPQQKLLTGGSWDCVFAYAGEQGAGDGAATIKNAVPGGEVPTTPFSRWDVEELYGAVRGGK